VTTYYVFLKVVYSHTVDEYTDLVLQSNLLGGIVLAHVVEVGVGANHRAALVLGLVHDLEAVGPVEFRYGHKRGLQARKDNFY
jgi:hypothetical protein